MSEVWSAPRRHVWGTVRGRRARVPEPTCRYCGCTEDRACPGGCGWMAPNLCSQCFELAEELGKWAWRVRRKVRGSLLGSALLERLVQHHRTRINRWALVELDAAGCRCVLGGAAERTHHVAECPVHGGTPVAKPPGKPAPVSTRRSGLKVSHATPRLKSRDSRQGGGRRG